MNNNLFRSLVPAFLFLAAVSFLIIIKSNPGILAKKKAGVFEFVRRGEDLLDKERYAEAASYFERAYEAAPENRVISSDLVYAYSRHASAFAQAKDHDRAIELFRKAHAVAGNQATAQNLALAYLDRGISSLDAGRTAMTSEDFTIARETASASRLASRNLSVTFFNAAVKDYKAGKNRNAMTLLKEASLTADDPRIFEFMGDIYYKDTELGDAAFYWKRSLDMDPENRSLMEKLAKLEKEQKLTEGERKFVSEYFNIRYGKGLAVDALAIRAILKDAYRDVGRGLGYYPGSRTTVFFYSPENFKEIFKLPDMVRAFYDGNIRMPFPASGLSGNELIHYIYHEYAHAVVSAMTNNNCPVWLSEGIAVMEEFHNDKAPGLPRFEVKDGSKNIPIGDVAAAFEQKDIPDADMAYYYLMAYSAVRYIVDRYGLGGLRAILRRVGEGQHVMNAIDDEFLLSEKEFNRRWGEYISNQKPVTSNQKPVTRNQKKRGR